MQHIADAKFVRQNYQERVQNAERNYRFRHLKASTRQPMAKLMTLARQALVSFVQTRPQPIKPAVHTK